MSNAPQPKVPKTRRRTCESAPSFKLDTAYTKMVDRVVGLRWSDQDEHVIGQGSGLDLGTNLQLTYQFENRPMRYITIPIIKTATGVTQQRRRIICSGCDAPVGILFYKPDLWRCRRCHDLVYASQQRDPVSRVAGQYDRLMVTAHRARREGEHRKTYERRKAEAKSRLAILSTTPHWGEDGRPISEAITTTYLPG